MFSRSSWSSFRVELGRHFGANTALFRWQVFVGLAFFVAPNGCQIHKSTLPGATFKAGHVDMFRSILDPFVSWNGGWIQYDYEQKISGKSMLTHSLNEHVYYQVRLCFLNLAVPTAANCQIAVVCPCFTPKSRGCRLRVKRLQGFQS